MSIRQRIRQAIQAGRIRFSEHAIEEMDKDNLTASNIRSILSSGKIIEEQFNDDFDVKYIVRGEINNEEVDVVCCFHQEKNLLIITVFKVTPIDESGDEDDEQFRSTL